MTHLTIENILQSGNRLDNFLEIRFKSWLQFRQVRKKAAEEDSGTAFSGRSFSV